MSDTLGNPVQPVVVTPPDPAVTPVATPAGVAQPILPAPDAGKMSGPIGTTSLTPGTPGTVVAAPVVNRAWKRDLDREIATMKGHTPRAYATEAEELIDLNGDINRMLTMAGHNATAKELVTFLEALVKKYTTTAKSAPAPTTVTGVAAPVAPSQLK